MQESHQVNDQGQPNPEQHPAEDPRLGDFTQEEIRTGSYADKWFLSIVGDQFTRDLSERDLSVGSSPPPSSPNSSTDEDERPTH